MTQLNQKMCDLLDKARTALIELDLPLPQLPPAQLQKLKNLLRQYVTESKVYRAMLEKDQILTTDLDILKMEAFIMKVEEATLANIVNAVEQLVTFVKEKTAGNAVVSVTAITLLTVERRDT